MKVSTSKCRARQVNLAVMQPFWLLNAPDVFDGEEVGFEADFQLQPDRVARAVDRVVEW